MDFDFDFNDDYYDDFDDEDDFSDDFQLRISLIYWFWILDVTSWSFYVMHNTPNLLSLTLNPDPDSFLSPLLSSHSHVMEERLKALKIPRPGKSCFWWCEGTFTVRLKREKTCLWGSKNQ